MRLALCVSIAALSLTTTAAHAQTYNVIDLGASGGIGSRAYDINNVGQVVGYVSPEYGASRAAIWNGKLVTDLGTAGGTDSVAYSVNDYGVAVGRSTNSTNGSDTHIITWSGTAVANLGYGSAYGINNAGQFVGELLQSNSNPGGFADATLWDSGNTATNLGVAAGTHCCWYFIGSMAFAINNNGLVAGVSDGGATVWNGTTVTDLRAIDQSNASTALSINDVGQVVGYSSFDDTDHMHATLWNGTSVTDLGTLDGLSDQSFGSQAFDINNAGLIVGVSNTALGDTHAVLWDGGVTIDLNGLIDPELALYVTLFEARAINNSGWIAANGIDSRTGEIHGYVLAPVPLPTAAWLLISGIGGFGMFTRRRPQFVDL